MEYVKKRSGKLEKFDKNRIKKAKDRLFEEFLQKCDKITTEWIEGMIKEKEVEKI